MLKLTKATCVALLSSSLLTGCVLEEDSNDYSVNLQVSDVEQGVAEVTVTVTGDDVNGKDIAVKPHMQMVGGMEHGTPFSANEGQLDDNGQFTTTAYFLMPTAMPESMGGSKMGDWSINVEFNGATTNFPITVDMMGTDKKDLKGTLADDAISHMGNDVARSYYLFDLGRKTMNNMDEFSVYIAARETLFDYAAIEAGAVLNEGTTYELSLGTIIVSMCLASVEDCDDDNNWTQATTNESGIYTATDLGLTGTSDDEIRVRLTIDGSTKLTSNDGTGVNYATFTFAAMDMSMGMSM